jgi:putative FmdB family regulatory protein
MPTYEYMCKKCGPFTQLRPMAECELPSACPECGTRAPRVLLTAPGCLTMSGEARQAGAKYERSTDGLHEVPPYLRDPAGMTKKLKTAQKLKRARARASRPPD